MIGDLISTLANAQKLSIQQIQRGVQSGSIPSYIGIPLIEQKTKQMQQAAAALQGQQAQSQTPIAEQVMQAADQVTRPGVPPAPTLPATDRQRPAPSLGLEAARSNMPEEYAGGGIVAFANRGQVEAPDSEVNPLTDVSRLLSPSNWPISRVAGEEGLAEKMGLSPSTLYKAITGRRERPAPEFAPEDSLLEVADMNRQYPTPPAQTQPQPQPQTPAPQAQPQTPPAPTGIPELKIERGVNPPPAAPPAAEAPSAFGGIEELYKGYMDRSRTDRDELRNLILGQKADRPQEERDNLSMALMKAGAGMMAGRSPFAGVNIGEGAMAGVESYGKGLEQLRTGDRQVVQQLAALGLKGQELEQAAMKMGIDMSHYKMLEPYYSSAAAENKAKAGLYPTQGRLYEAQVGETEAQTLERLTHANLMPEELRQKQLRAAGAGRADMAGSVPAAAIDKLDTKVEGWIAEPLAPTTPFSSELRRNPQIVKALQLNDPENPEYIRALDVVRTLADRERLKKMAEYRRESEKRRLPTYNPYAED